MTFAAVFVGVGAAVVGVVTALTFTVKVPETVTLPNNAVILAVPAATALPSPKADIVATAAFELL